MRWLPVPRRAHSWLGLRAWRAIPLALVALVSMALASSAFAAGNIRITAPASGANVPGPDVTVTVDVGTLKLVPGTQATTSSDLHIHYLLDVDATPYLDGKTPVPFDNPHIIHSTDTSHTFTDVGPGPHKVAILLTDKDHKAVQPPDHPSVSFSVAGAGVDTASLPKAGGVPADLMTVFAAAGGALVFVGLVISRRLPLGALVVASWGTRRRRADRSD
jgi:hypothetical protein